MIVFLAQSSGVRPDGKNILIRLRAEATVDSYSFSEQMLIGWT